MYQEKREMTLMQEESQESCFINTQGSSQVSENYVFLEKKILKAKVALILHTKIIVRILALFWRENSNEKF